LRWQQVDLNAGLIRLEHTKNGERRARPLAGHALERVKERAKVRRIDTDLLFLSKTNLSKPIDLRSPWETALKQAGIADFRWHDLRHSAASYLVPRHTYFDRQVMHSADEDVIVDPNAQLRLTRSPDRGA